MVDISRDVPRRRKRLIRTAAVLVFLGLVTLGFCQMKPPAPRVSSSSLWIDTVRTGPMSVEIRGAGTLVPEEVEWIAAATNGRVAKIVVETGAAVTSDSVLIELTNPEVVQAARDAALAVRAAEAELRSRRVQLQSQLLTQEAVVAAVRADYEDARNRAAADGHLAAEGLTSALTAQSSRGREQQLGVRKDVEEKRVRLARQAEETDLDAARSRIDQLQEILALRRQQLDGLIIRAGRTGVIQQIGVEVGAQVTAGANLARVAAPEPLKAVVQISQVDASQVVIGQRVRVDTNHGIVEGTVARIDPAVQNGSVTLDVRLPTRLPQGVRPDLAIDAAIEIDRIERAIYVSRPVQASSNQTISLYRLSANGKEAKRVAVRIGRTSFKVVEITNGLSPGDRVVLSDMARFEAHERITITE